MVRVSKGIPDDSPENTVRTIEEILREESIALGAKFHRKETAKGVSREITIDIEAKGQDRAFRIILTYVESHELALVTGTIGNGLISGGWVLELLPKDMLHAPHSPPFRWALYRRDSVLPPDPLTTRPEHILDGALLRRLLYEQLGFPPPS